MFDRLSKLWSKSQATPAANVRRSFRPKVEGLEDRWCPATTFGVNNGTLTITGDAQANHILIRDGGNGTVTGNIVDGNQPTGRDFAFINVSRIVVSTNGGNDGVTYLQTGDRSSAMTFVAHLGSGNDVFHSEIQGDIRTFSFLEMFVRGNADNDTIGVHADSDTDVQALSLLRVDLNGNEGKDTILALYRGEADGELRLNARGGSSDDTIAVRMDMDVGSEGRLGAANDRATVEGNSGNDTLTFRVHTPGSPFFKVTATIDGGSNTWIPFRRKDVGRHTSNVASTGLEQDIVV
jgi:hypothetical protein